MSNKKKMFLGVITARGGSKGIKNKNIKLLNGLPLIAYSIKAALKSKGLDDCIVSTEDEKIARVAKKFGAKVPFMRPAHLAEDKSPTVPVLQDAVLKYEQMFKMKVDYIVLLQPTSPLRLARDIDRGISMLKAHQDKDNLLSVFRCDNIHPKKMYINAPHKITMYVPHQDGVFRRQDTEDLLMRNGAVYIIRRDLLFKGRMFADKPLLMVMPKLRSVDIDGMPDFVMAQLILKAKAHLKD